VQIVVGKPEGKRLHGRPRHWRGIIVKYDVREVSLEGVDWISPAPEGGGGWWLAVLNAAINLREP
jgi:hypothetical protein